jgi:hypothetical protein
LCIVFGKIVYEDDIGVRTQQILLAGMMKLKSYGRRTCV